MFYVWAYWLATLLRDLIHRGIACKVYSYKVKRRCHLYHKNTHSHQESIEGRRWEAAAGNWGRLIRTRAGEKGGRDRESDRRREWRRRWWGRRRRWWKYWSLVRTRGGTAGSSFPTPWRPSLSAIRTPTR